MSLLRLCVILPMLMTLPCVVMADEIRDFTTDGCSSFPDGSSEEEHLWRACCVVHDIAYWKGGSKVERKAADVALRNCVAKVGREKTAELMLAGVRAGGSPWFPTSYRWAYGWPWGRGYQELNEEEAKIVARKLEAVREQLEKEGASRVEPGDAEVTENKE